MMGGGCSSSSSSNDSSFSGCFPCDRVIAFDAALVVSDSPLRHTLNNCDDFVIFVTRWIIAHTLPH